jgi:hypothetical protein
MPWRTFLGHTSIGKTASRRRFQAALGRLAICQFGVLSGVSAAQAAPFSPPIACRQFAPVTDFDPQRFFCLAPHPEADLPRQPRLVYYLGGVDRVAIRLQRGMGVVDLPSRPVLAGNIQDR